MACVKPQMVPLLHLLHTFGFSKCLLNAPAQCETDFTFGNWLQSDGWPGLSSSSVLYRRPPWRHLATPALPSTPHITTQSATTLPTAHHTDDMNHSMSHDMNHSMSHYIRTPMFWFVHFISVYHACDPSCCTSNALNWEPSF